MLHEKKILSLRELAISHLPIAQRNITSTLKYLGPNFLDSDTSSSANFTMQNPRATVVEKLAAELITLTFMHLDTWPEYPHKRDPADAEDAEAIKDNIRSMETARELQPQIEAAMLEAARLLCELTGAPLPPWMTADTEPPAGTAKPLQRTTAQDLAILTAIKQAGHDPLMLPINKPGKPGVKAVIREALKGNVLFVGTVFKRAWERLRSAGDIADKLTLPRGVSP